MSEQPGRDRHRWKTLLLAIFTLLVLFGAVFAVVAFARPLDEIGFLRFPLGFFLLAQGLLIATLFHATAVAPRPLRRSRPSIVTIPARLRSPIATTVSAART